MSCLLGLSNLQFALIMSYENSFIIHTYRTAMFLSVDNRALSQTQRKAKTTVTRAKRQSAHARSRIFSVLLIFKTIHGHYSVRSLNMTEELYPRDSPVVFAKAL